MAEQQLIQLLLVAAFAFAVPILVTSIRGTKLPIAVGEIIAGIVIGPQVLGLIDAEPGTWLRFLSQFGLAYLMYMSGLAVDFAAFRKPSATSLLDPNVGASGKPLAMAMKLFGASLVLSLVASYAMAAIGLITNPLYMGVVLSATGLGLVSPLLQERGLLRSPLGQTLLVASLFAGFLSMMGVTLLAALSSPSPVFVLGPLVLILIMFLGALLGRARKLRDRIRRLLDRLAHSTAQLPVRGAFLMMLSFMVMSEFLGSAVMLGAFMGGVLSSWLSGAEQPILTIKLDAIGYGFFIPVFFICLGASLDVSTVLSSPQGWALACGLFAVALAVKLLPATLLLRTEGVSRAERWASGFVMATRLNVFIVAGEVGLSTGSLDEAMHSGLVLTAVALALVCPIAFSRLLPRREKQVTTLDLSPFLDYLLGSTQGEHGSIRVREEVVSTHSPLVGSTLGETEIGSLTGVNVIGIRRPDGNYKNSPSADTTLRAGDVLLATGTDEELEQLHWLLWW